MNDEKEQLKELIAQLQKEAKAREEKLQSENKAMKELLNPTSNPAREDLVEAVYNDIEHYTPLPPLVAYDALRKMKGAPSGYINGNHYLIPSSEINESHPWWKRV